MGPTEAKNNKQLITLTVIILRDQPFTRTIQYTELSLIMINGWLHIVNVFAKNFKLRIDIRLVQKVVLDSKASDDLCHLHRVLFRCPVTSLNAHHCIWLHLSLDQAVGVCFRITSSMNLDEEHAKVFTKLSIQNAAGQLSPDFIGLSPGYRYYPLPRLKVELLGQSCDGVLSHRPASKKNLEIKVK